MTNRFSSADIIKRTRLFILISLAFTLMLSPHARVFANSDFFTDNNILFFDESGGAVTCGGGGGSGATLSENIPPVWRDLINNAAPLHPDADARLVAAVLWAENRGWPVYKTSGWGVSTAGAAGPWQFIPSSWELFGMDGDGDGKKDRDNPADAVRAAFNHHAGSMGKPIAQTGYAGADAAADFETIVFQRNQQNLLSFAASYNGSGAPNNTLLKSFPRNENSDYVRMVYWLLATDFDRGWMPDSDQFVEAATTGAMFEPGSDGEGSRKTRGPCNSRGGVGGVNPEGYSFPVAPQRKSENGGVPGMTRLPCENVTTGCHHDGTSAFDISKKPGGNAAAGTPVYAIQNGTVKNIRGLNKGGGEANNCFIMQYQAEDTFIYAYLHIQNPTVSKGQTVSAGTKVAEIGNKKCGYDTVEHLHIDRGCVRNGVPQTGGSDSCRDPGFNDLINALYEGLPE